MKNVNIKLSLAITFVVFHFIAVNAQTNISGFISSNTTWTLAGSPYIVIGNTLVLTGVTLTIDPGVLIKFDTSRAIQIDGTLIAIGTASNRITFTSNKPSPSAGDWGRIQFSDSSINASYNSNGNYISGSIMKYCDVLYGGKVIASGTAAVEMYTSSPYISNCNIISSGGKGILCSGSSVRIDSSSIKYCMDYGLYFGPISVITGPCPLIIQDDTISFNSSGGIGLNNTSSPCNQDPIRILINRNYFNGNMEHGALCTVNNFLDKIVVSENIFENNISTQIQTAGGAYLNATDGPIVECNRFINNQGTDMGALYLRDGGYTAGIVRNNIFEGNTCTSTSSLNCTVWYETNNPDFEEYFTNNIVKNNIAPSGSICRFSGWPLISPLTTFHIDNNDFINNQALNTIYLNGTVSAFNDQFATFTYNNFINSGVQYEIYNDCPFGSPNIDVDNNYWNNTNTLHVDSVIYDFFDDATKSVAYYLPILNTAVLIDTACAIISTGISRIENSNLNPLVYPNPATAYMYVAFDKIINEGAIEIYNIMGGKVFEENIYQKIKVEVNLQSISNGIYLVRVFDGNRYFYHKIIVEHN